MSRILKANSTGWKKFCRLLEGKEGCEFKEDKCLHCKLVILSKKEGA